MWRIKALDPVPSFVGVIDIEGIVVYPFMIESGEATFILQVHTIGGVKATIPVIMKFCGTEVLTRSARAIQRHYIYKNTGDTFKFYKSEWNEWIQSEIAHCPTVSFKLMRSWYDPNIPPAWVTDYGAYRSQEKWLVEDLSIDGKYPVTFQNDIITVKPISKDSSTRFEKFDMFVLVFTTEVGISKGILLDIELAKENSTTVQSEELLSVLNSFNNPLTVTNTEEKNQKKNLPVVNDNDPVFESPL